MQGLGTVQRHYKGLGSAHFTEVRATVGSDLREPMKQGLGTVQIYYQDTR